MQSMSTFKDKLFCLIKGPGWFPGTERLGDPMQVPEVTDCSGKLNENKVNFTNQTTNFIPETRQSQIWA